MAETQPQLPLKSTSGTSPPTRRPYNGSCHCGATKYIVYLTLPTDSIQPTTTPPNTTPIYKCNCTTCYKMAIFHMRPLDPPSDFLLLSPLDPLQSSAFQDYFFKGNSHWFFCATCGVRCFTFRGGGEGEVREEEVEFNGEKKKVKGWGIKREDWEGELGNDGYLSVNAVTLDQRQEGLDMREWTEKGWVLYYDTRKEVEEEQMGRPHEGDMY